jgi:hypothetical protein
VQSSKQHEQQGTTQKKQGMTTRCNKANKQQGATQEEQSMTSKVTRCEKIDDMATRCEQPCSENIKV